MVYDVIVVGAGVVGTSTAYHLATQGLHVTLIEQFPWPNSRGSSHGHSRTLRRNYVARHSHYTPLADRSIQDWRRIERQSGLQIYKEIGVLSYALDNAVLEDSIKSLETAGMSFTPVSSAQVNERYPMFHFPKDSGGIFEESGGIIMADNGLKALMNLFLKSGGELRDREEVTSIEPGDGVTTVQTSRGVYQTRKVVIAAGPWSKKLLQKLGLSLPLLPTRITVMYWKERVPGSFLHGRMPCFRIIDGCGRGRLIYGIPSLEYPGLVKLCLHEGVVTDPEIRDDVNTSYAIKEISDFIRSYIPGLEDRPSIVEACYYTMTPTSDVILDTHPRYKNIVIGAGFSGHGFKLAPVFGEILSNLATNQDQQVDLQHFKIPQSERKPPTAARL